MKTITGVLFAALAVSGCSPAPDASGDSPEQDWGPRIQAVNDALLNRGEVDRIGEFFSASYIGHGRDGATTSGTDGIAGFITALRAAFPDLSVETEVLMEEGDMVTWLRTHRGTLQGDLMGVTGTGQQLVWQSIVVTRYDGDLIAEEWGVSDLGEVLLSQ